MGHSYSHHQRTDQFQISKHWLKNQSDIFSHFQRIVYWNGYFQSTPFENAIFCSIQSNFKIKPFPCTCKSSAVAGFIFNVHDNEEIVVVVTVEEEVSMRRVLVLPMVIETVVWLSTGKTEWKNEFSRLEDKNTNVYLFLLRSLTLSVSYIFVTNLKCFSRKFEAGGLWKLGMPHFHEKIRN